MPDVAKEILNWIFNLEISGAIRSFSGVFVFLPFLHIISTIFIVVSISKIDLRLMGIGDKQSAVTELLADILPWTWAAFAIAAISGMLLFMSNAPGFYKNESFRLMILFIVLAGINMGVFHAFTYRGVSSWDSDVPTPFAAKVAGGLSLVFWIVAFASGWRIEPTVGH